ncbi:GTPase HflX [Halobacteriales archaeon SW_6_65_15]|nr:MAG: GTPase HflX [Halobacteriales archaeon SW_6_65_15]
MQSRKADAVIAKRADPEDEASEATEEIRKLAEAAGYEVVAEVTQTRPEDTTYQFGRGKAEELAEVLAETGARVVVFDNDLSPTQTFELAELCPDGTQLLDRYRLVLAIFEEQAGSKRAKLQVERAQLQYDLPRVREEITRERAGEFLQHDEKGGQRVRDIERRIDELDRKLAELGDESEQRRQRRREEGFEFVALAGYTNAGKSTLLHRLADDLDFGDREPDHADLDGTAEIEDRLFKTLDTTTRRATIEDRPTLVTDTVGFVDDLPHELVSSFHETLSATDDADCVLVVADAEDPPAELRRKLETSFDLLDGTDGEVVTVLNKADLLSETELAERERAIREIAPDLLPVSATEGYNLDALRDRIADALPDLQRAELALPNDDEAMSLVSWLYDRASVEDVTYGDEVRIEFAAKESVVEQAKARAEKIGIEA